MQAWRRKAKRIYNVVAFLKQITSTTVTIAQHAGDFGVVGTALLIALLIAKNLLEACEQEKAGFLEKRLNIALIPMLFMFALIVLVKTIQVLA